MKMHFRIKSCCLLAGLLASGCGAISEGPAKKAPANLIATPASYYSTAKARYLGTKYKDNLDRLTEKIIRNPATTQLQFANNISSVGGIGFFTHSATKTSDERYLEVVLATPETFESKGDYSEKVQRLFSRYGQDLLSILAGDSDIFQDKELAGYGLNLNWRTVIADGPANRVSLARAVVYFHKEKVAGFLRRSISQNELLSDAVIFAVEDDGPLQLVSYQHRENKPDSRPAIREDDLLADGRAKPASGGAPKDGSRRSIAIAPGKLEPGKAEETLTATASKPSRSETETSPLPVSDKSRLREPVATSGVRKSVPMAPVKSDGPKSVREAESAPLSIPPVESQSVKPVPEIVLPKTSPQKMAKPAAESAAAKPQKSAPSPSKAEAMKASTDVANEDREGPIIEDSEESKTSPVFSSGHPSAKTLAPSPLTLRSSTMPEIAKADSTKKPEFAATRRPTEISRPNIQSSVPAVRTQPETHKVPADAAAPAKTAAVVKSPMLEMKPAISPERLETETAEADNLPSPPSLTGKILGTSPAAETKSSAPPRSDAPNVPPARIPRPVTTSEAKEAAKNHAREPKPSTSPTGVETSSPPPAKLPAAPEVASTVEKVAKSSDFDTKQSSSPAGVETAAAPAGLAEPSAVAAAQATAKVPLAERKLAASSMPTEIPAVPSVSIAARPALAGDSFKSSMEPTKIDQKRHGGEQPVFKKPVEQATAVPPEQPSQSVRPAPTPATTSAPMPREEIKAQEPTLVEAPAKKPAHASNSVKVDDAGSAFSAAEKDVAEPFTGPLPAKSAQPEKAGEQLALLRKPVDPLTERAPVTRPAPKALQGFIIQVAFQDKQQAQSWAEKMTQRGYAVSITEVGPEGSLRVRLGNFAVRDEAERQLQNFKQEGIRGIIINLPQAFRPEAVSSIP